MDVVRSATLAVAERTANLVAGPVRSYSVTNAETASILTPVVGG